jgi:hypothetical protein
MTDRPNTPTDVEVCIKALANVLNHVVNVELQGSASKDYVDGYLACANDVLKAAFDAVPKGDTSNTLRLQ